MTFLSKESSNEYSQTQETSPKYGTFTNPPTREYNMPSNTELMVFHSGPIHLELPKDETNIQALITILESMKKDVKTKHEESKVSTATNTTHD